MFMIEMLASKSILCTDGEFHTRNLVGPGGWGAKTWKTKAGATRYSDQRWNQGAKPIVRVVELDEKGCPVAEEYDWKPVSLNGNRYEVNFRQNGLHDVIVLCQRRDTGLEYSRPIKHNSKTWNDVVNQR